MKEECRLEIAALIEQTRADINVDPLLQKACADIHSTSFLQQGIHVDVGPRLLYQSSDFQTTFFLHVSISSIEFFLETLLDSTRLIFIRSAYSFNLIEYKF